MLVFMGSLNEDPGSDVLGTIFWHASQIYRPEVVRRVNHMNAHSLYATGTLCMGTIMTYNKPCPNIHPKKRDTNLFRSERELVYTTEYELNIT